MLFVLTFHIQVDLRADRHGDVVVVGLADELSAQIQPRDARDGQRVLQRPAERRLEGGVQQVVVPPPSQLGKGVTCAAAGKKT